MSSITWPIIQSRIVLVMNPSKNCGHSGLMELLGDHMHMLGGGHALIL